MSKVTEDKRHIRSRDRTKILGVHATIASLRAFQLENTLGRSSETGVTLGIDS